MTPEALTSLSAGALVLAVFTHPLVRAVLGLLAANVLVGIAASLYRRQFYLAEVGNWLFTRVVPYLLGAGAMQLVLMTVPGEWSGLQQTVAGAVWLFVIAALLGRILDTLRELGLPVPAMLGEKPA